MRTPLRIILAITVLSSAADGAAQPKSRAVEVSRRRVQMHAYERAEWARREKLTQAALGLDPLGSSRRGLDVLGKMPRTLPAGLIHGPVQAPPQSELVSLRRLGANVLVSGPDTLPPEIVSNLADASELAALHAQAQPSAERGPVNLAFYGFSERDLAMIVRQFQSDVKQPMHSPELVASAAVHARSLSRKDYDFTNAQVVIHELGAEPLAIAHVTVTLPSKRSGFRAAVIEIVVRAVNAFDKANRALTAAVLKSLHAMMATVVPPPAPASKVEELDPIAALHREIRQLEQLHGIDIQTYISDSAGDWQLTTLLRRADRG